MSKIFALVKQFLSKNWNKLIPVFLAAFIWIVSYKGGWMLGWDNLVPELNLPLNLKRTISSVWQGYRGVGHVDGMAQGANLVHILTVWLMSFLMPTNLIRYVWHGLMYLLGVCGIQVLFESFFKQKESGVKISSLSVGILYALNLATVQNFYTPFEPFSAFFAFLPWLLYGLKRYLDKGDLKSLSIFSLLTILSGPAYMVQTMYVVSFIVLFIFGLINSMGKNLKRLLKAMFSYIVLNLYWLIPAFWFVISGAGDLSSILPVSVSTTNMQYFSDAYGSLIDLISLKGFSFSFLDVGGENKFELLMGKWVDWMNQGWVVFSSVLIFVSAFIGSIFGLIKKKRSVVSLLVIGLISLVMLSGNNGLFGGVYSFLNDYVPFFGQIFRTSFTKWSVVLGLVFSLGFGFGAEAILGKSKKFVHGLVVGCMLGVQVLVSLPIFSGIVYEKMFVDLPNDYFELYDYLNNSSLEGKVLPLPIDSRWGWITTDWGYRGSGFSWFGIERPTYDRAFSVWSQKNYDSYEDFSTALYSQNVALFEEYLKEYEVLYLIYDNSISQAKNRKDLSLEIMNKISTESETIRLVERFGAIDVYEFRSDNEDYEKGLEFSKLVSSSGNNSLVLEELTITGDKLKFDGEWVGRFMLEEIDGKTNLTLDVEYPKIYSSEGNSIYEGSFDSILVSTFVDWNELDYVFIDSERIQVSGEKLYFYLPIIIENGKINVEISFVSINKDKSTNSDIYTDLIFKDRVELDVPDLYIKSTLRKVDLVFSQGLFLKDYGRLEAFNCDSVDRGEVGRVFNELGLELSSNDWGNSCDYISVPSYINNGLYGIRIVGQNFEGRPLLTYAHGGSGREDFLSNGENGAYEIVDIFEGTGKGLTLNFESVSFGNAGSRNRIESIEVLALPKTWIENSFHTDKDSENRIKEKNVQTVQKLQWIAVGFTLVSFVFSLGFVLKKKNRFLN